MSLSVCPCVFQSPLARFMNFMVAYRAQMDVVRPMEGEALAFPTWNVSATFSVDEVNCPGDHAGVGP